MSNDYGYINARIRAMKSFLLKEEDYLEALRQNTADEFISYLSSRPGYSNDMHQISNTQTTRSACDEALKLNLCRIFRKILKFSEGKPKELILILLRPWDIYNLKTIIRGILNYQHKDEIMQATIAAGKWDLEFLKLLIQAKDLKALSNILINCDDDLEKEFAQLIKNYSLDKPLEVLENTLTQIYFQKECEFLTQRNTNDQIALDYLSLQIDFLNILLVLRKITQGTDPSLRLQNGFIKGGRKLSNAFLKYLIAFKSVEDALKAFAQSPYPWLAQEGLNLYKRNNRLSIIERLLKNKFFSFCFYLYTKGDPLSISIPLAFINFKENEIRNLRLLGKAINFGIPADLVKEELVFA